MPDLAIDKGWEIALNIYANSGICEYAHNPELVLYRSKIPNHQANFASKDSIN